MEITSELIDRIAGLAELSVSEGERDRIRGDMEQMLGFVNCLKEADTDGIELVAGEGRTVALREDAAVTSETPEELVSGAPGLTDGMVAVPRSI